MRIISYNVNGLRAAIGKGFIDWLATHPADIVCLQEIKAERENIPVEKIEALGFETFWFSAQKKGYSGVAVFTKIKPTNIVYGSKIEQSDFEGRVIQLDFEKFTLINAYYPSGTSGNERQAYKYVWLAEFFNYLNELKKIKAGIIVCGDYNIAHKEIDIHNPKGNKNQSGFLPEEREWMDRFYATDFVDTFRFIHPEKKDHYSWWSQRFPTVRAQNKGWRIDYISLSANLKEYILDAKIFPEIKHSDHCPVYAEFNF